jgi:protein TonB
MSSGKYSRKAIVGFVVIGLHVALAIGIIVATAFKYVPQLAEALDMRLVKQVEEEMKKTPPPPPPDFKPPPVQTPLVDLPIVEGPPPPKAIVAPKVEAKPEPKPAPKPEPPPITQAKVAKGVNLGDLCSSYYPSASRRLSEEGSVVLLVFVAPNGKVTETKVETSSGYQRLDEAAAKCVTSQGKFDPTKVGNDAVGSWQRMKWTWRLAN